MEEAFGVCRKFMEVCASLSLQSSVVVSEPNLERETTHQLAEKARN
jgi:hypothetical protein